LQSFEYVTDIEHQGRNFHLNRSFTSQLLKATALSLLVSSHKWWRVFGCRYRPALGYQLCGPSRWTGGSIAHHWGATPPSPGLHVKKGTFGLQLSTAGIANGKSLGCPQKVILI